MKDNLSIIEKRMTADKLEVEKHMTADKLEIEKHITADRQELKLFIANALLEQENREDRRMYKTAISSILAGAAVAPECTAKVVAPADVSTGGSGAGRPASSY